MHIEIPDVRTVPGTEMMLGENPIWDERTGSLYWIDIAAPGVARLYEENLERWPLPAQPGALALCTDGTLLVAMRTGFALLDPTTGEISPCGPQVPYDPGHMRFNDGRVDRHGNFWVGSIDERPGGTGADLFMLDRRGHLHTKLSGGLTICNGIAFSLAGDSLYLADTPRYEISRYSLDGGCLASHKTYVTCDKAHGRPDGAAVDSEGYYWSALIGYIARYDADGQLDRLMRVPAGRITMLAFGGADRKTMFLTTADHDHIYADVAREPLAGNLLTLSVGIAGVVENRFDPRALRV